MTSVSTMGQVNEQIERLKVLQQQLGDLSNQIASGKKTTLLKGLGTETIASVRSRANFNMLDTYNENITVAQRRMKMMLSGITQFQTQGRNVLALMEGQTQEGQVDMTNLKNLSTNSLSFMSDLLNQQDGDRYLFAGSDTRTKPLNDTGTLDTYLQTQINNWVNGAITTDQFINSYRDTTQLTDTIAGYSVPLASGDAKDVYVRADKSTDINYTSKANAQAYRDVLVGTSLIKNLTTILDKVSLQTGDDPLTTTTAPGASHQEQNDNFNQVYTDIIQMMHGGLDLVDSEGTNIGLAQNQANQIAENHKIDQNALQNTIGAVEDVDLNDAALKINALQIQLDASYRITAALSNLSLVNYI